VGLRASLDAVVKRYTLCVWIKIISNAGIILIKLYTSESYTILN